MTIDSVIFTAYINIAFSAHCDCTSDYMYEIPIFHWVRAFFSYALEIWHSWRIWCLMCDAFAKRSENKNQSCRWGSDRCNVRIRSGAAASRKLSEVWQPMAFKIRATQLNCISCDKTTIFLFTSNLRKIPRNEVNIGLQIRMTPHERNRIWRQYKARINRIIIIIIPFFFVSPNFSSFGDLECKHRFTTVAVVDKR